VYEAEQNKENDVFSMFNEPVFKEEKPASSLDIIMSLYKEQPKVPEIQE